MQNKVEKLLQSTIYLASEKGLVGASTAKIAKHAKVATGTLFHHFPTKEHLISAAYMAVQKDYAWNVVGIFDYPKVHLEQRLIKFIKSSINYWARHRSSLLYTLQVSGSMYYTPTLQLKAESQNQHLILALTQGIKQKILLKTDPATLFHLLTNSVIQTARIMLDQNDPSKTKKIRKAGVNFVWNAIRNPDFTSAS